MNGNNKLSLIVITSENNFIMLNISNMTKWNFRYFISNISFHGKKSTWCCTFQHQLYKASQI